MCVVVSACPFPCEIISVHVSALVGLRWTILVLHNWIEHKTPIRDEWSALLLARRTTPPVNDLGFVDLETVIIVRGEARRHPDRAIDIVHLAAASADQVMMVVIDSILVPSCGSGRLDPADEVLVDQHA